LACRKAPPLPQDIGHTGFFGTGASCDFSQWPAPGTNGKFNVTAIFDQEDDFTCINAG
jgi:hypothetical protein